MQWTLIILNLHKLRWNEQMPFEMNEKDKKWKMQKQKQITKVKLDKLSR